VPKIRRPGARVKVISDYLERVILLHRNAHILLIFQWSLNRRSEDARLDVLREAALTRAKFSIKRQIAAQSTCFDCGPP
jgi:hypothetical protein